MVHPRIARARLEALLTEAVPDRKAPLIESSVTAWELILKDLEIYHKASISQIHGRIGNEIPRRKLHQLKLLVKEGGRRGHSAGSSLRFAMLEVVEG